MIAGRLFDKTGLDPRVHIVDGNKKDNFWMMGDTGPCGPLLRIAVDLTPAGGPEVRWSNEQRRVHRNLEPGLHSVQREPRRHILAASGEARGHGHGLRAGHEHHPGHEKLHRLRKRQNFELRDRYLPANI